MPKQARNYNNQYELGYTREYPRIVTPTPHLKPIPKRRVLKRKKVNPFKKFFGTIFSLIFLSILGFFVLPYGYNVISSELLFGPKYQEVQVNSNRILNPTIDYLANNLVLGTPLFTGTSKKPEMNSLYMTQEMPVIKTRLLKLMSSYKDIDPSVFVWDYENGKYVDIDSEKLYSAASIIKIPVLIRLFKSIEANQLTIYDEMTLTNYFKAPGSGDLQFKSSGGKYTIDELARKMIQISDNSATNMLMSAIGSMNDVNAGIRGWGLKHTMVNNWLPDMAGTNYTTTKDLGTMLYNLDNPGFLNINSREYIIDYMSHVKNDRLIQQGLGKGALFVHKTGDIGKTFGDAGIVYMPNGKKYIVAILANRPYNSHRGVVFVQKASKIIYDSISAGMY